MRARAATVAMIAFLLFGASAHGKAPPSPSDWPLWRAYVGHFITADGRVIDHTGGAITTSEGQSYALFFALVADDRPLFHRILGWTRDNLAHGSLGAQLPSFKWGRRSDGTWGVLDENSAADSDLWIGYVLTEAGRLWHDDALGAEGRALLERVVEREVVWLPQLGPMLLPAPRGFALDARTWRLNPSYLPLQILRGLESESVKGPWRGIVHNTLRMIEARSTHGFVDDWVAYRRRRGFITDPKTGAIGSYDAIRAYLWAALLADGDPGKARLQARLAGPLAFWRRHGRVPERIDTRRPDAAARAGPVGFLGVLLPALHDRVELERLRGQIESARRGRLYGDPPRYYDHNLLLFAEGFVTERYRFAGDGRLIPAWSVESAP